MRSFLRSLVRVGFVGWAALLLSVSAAGPLLPPTGVGRDWLIDADWARATVQPEGNSWVLDNGLIRRVLQTSPNAATVAFDNRLTGESLLRAVGPEATLTLDGQLYSVGGLKGQPNRAYLLPEWVAGMTNNPQAFQFVGGRAVPVQTPFAWKRDRKSVV